MRRCLCVMAVVLAASLARAEFLYWQVSDTPDSSYESLGLSGDLYAAVRYGAEDTDISTWSLADDAYSETPYVKTGESLGLEHVAAVDLSTLTGENMAFYIEIYNYADGSYNSVAHSATATYTNLKDSGSITGAAMVDIPFVSISVWQGGGFTGAIPEPTSAMLMMFGVALVALRRKRT